MAEGLDLDRRLQRDHRPPVPERLLPAARAAVERARANEWDAVVVLPNGTLLTAGQVIALLQLDDLVA